MDLLEEQDDAARLTGDPDFAYVHRNPHRPSLVLLASLTALLAALHYLGTLDLFEPWFFLMVALLAALAAILVPGDLSVHHGGLVLPLSIFHRHVLRKRGSLPYRDIARCSADGPARRLTVETTSDERYDLYMGRGPGVTSAMAYVMARVDVERSGPVGTRRGKTAMAGRKGRRGRTCKAA